VANADFYADGEWNFICDLCGRKAKSSTAEKTWDNHYVCRSHKEVRNPQDFVRGVKDDQSLPWSRPIPADTYVTSWAMPILDTYGNVITATDYTPILDIGT
jgi:hypothetical protein